MALRERGLTADSAAVRLAGRREGRLKRHGIATAGNWIVDRVKLIDRWPDEETLAFIRDEQRGTGGGAYNAIIDLANLGFDAPLTGLGCIGNDADGAWIRDDLARRGIDHGGLLTVDQPTSYTDVMTVSATGRRTFFHHPGANAVFGPEHLDPGALHAKVLHLAYLLVLARLDAPDPDYGSVGARVLQGCHEAGLFCCLDIITETSPRVPTIVLPALPYVDCLIVNEVEAGVLSGETTRTKSLSAGHDTHLPEPQVTSHLSDAGVRAAGRKLLELGVRQQVVIHMPEGGYAVRADGSERFQPSLNLPPNYIAGAAGAGDAFAAGVLYGVHQDLPLDELLRLAVCTAAASLRHPTCTLGVGPLDETMSLLQTYGEREPPMRLE